MVQASAYGVVYAALSSPAFSRLVRRFTFVETVSRDRDGKKEIFRGRPMCKTEYQAWWVPAPS